MVTHQQMRKLMKLKGEGRPLAVSAAKAAMDEKTARKYLRAGKTPGEMKAAGGKPKRIDQTKSAWPQEIMWRP